MSQQLGKPVDDFSLCLLGGAKELSLRDCLLGKRGAVVAFWSAACTHCVRYDRYFNAFTELHPELGFVAIASRYGESPVEMRSVAARRGLRFPVLLDISGAVALQWNSQQTPRCYLIAAERTLIYRGAIDNFKAREDPEYVAYLEPAIAAFLAGKPIARPETASFGCAIQTVYYHLPKQL
jgi:peroxiredoxin